MSNFSKIVIIILIVLIFFFVKEKYGEQINNAIGLFKGMPKVEMPDIPQRIPEEEGEVVKAPVEVINPDTEKKETEVAEVYFLALDSNSNGIYKKVQREVPENKDKFEYAMEELLKGPNLIEKSVGAYSEIPKSSKLLDIKKSKGKIIIDLSSDFQYGGGTDSVYSRMMQLIKTSLANSNNAQIYLYLDGKQINAIGGEGIMISQPLSEKSLD
ncbi:GerMN domain-containing protein [bacterium]|nr:GerMN domain-containing protein [bacterium]